MRVFVLGVVAGLLLGMAIPTFSASGWWEQATLAEKRAYVMGATDMVLRLDQLVVDYRGPVTGAGVSAYFDYLARAIAVCGPDLFSPRFLNIIGLAKTESGQTTGRTLINDIMVNMTRPDCGR